MTEKGYELAGVEFDDTPPSDSDATNEREDADHEFGDEEDEEDQGVN